MLIGEETEEQLLARHSGPQSFGVTPPFEELHVAVKLVNLSPEMTTCSPAANVVSTLITTVRLPFV